MIRAHKLALDPTPSQRLYFAKGCGIARFAWNWALAEWDSQYGAGERPEEAALRRQLNAVKRVEFPWMLEVTKTAPQQAIKNLGAAFRRFFEKKAKRPVFKRKGIDESFRADNGPGTFKVNGKQIRLPVVGWIKLREPLRFDGLPKSATVSRVADRWFVSIAVEIDHHPPARESQAVVGIDLGVARLATLSDGTTIEGPKALRRELKRLRRLSRSLSRKRLGSANRRKAKKKLSRLHARIANVRRDALHKLTTDVARRFAIIGIEDLNVRGLMANGHMARGIADCGMYEFRRQLEYKAELWGARVIQAGRWFPSSKTCSACGAKVGSLPLSIRRWTCEVCRTEHDRDVNAARNLRDLATASFAGSHACGDRSSAALAGPGQRSRSSKQEPEDGTTVPDSGERLCSMAYLAYRGGL